MGFPYIFESNWESGDASEWDSETDGATPTQLDFPHYAELARFPWSTCAPFRGAYCMRIVLAGQTGDAFVQEGDINIADAATSYFRFMLWFAPDFTGTANDTFNLFEANSTSNVAEATLSGRIVATTDVINLGIGKTAATSWSGLEIKRGVWYTVELDVTIQTGGSGTIDLYITRDGDPPQTAVSATQVGSLTHLAVTHGRLGCQDHLATTTGTILFDQFVQDDARVYPIRDRWPLEILLTKSGHVFMGAGKIDNVSLMSGAGTDCVLTVYDTDTADTLDASNIKTELKNTANNELVDPAGMPVRDVVRGCYVSLSGTNPRALVQICRARGYMSVANIKSLGLAR